MGAQAWQSRHHSGLGIRALSPRRELSTGDMKAPVQTSMAEASTWTDEQPVLLSGAAHASPLATAGYLAVGAGHLALLCLHATTAKADGFFFTALAAAELALAFEAAIYALGSLGQVMGLAILTAAGRIRLLGAAIAWPWLLPWASELGCRSGVMSHSVGVTVTHQAFGLACLLTGFFVLSE